MFQEKRREREKEMELEFKDNEEKHDNNVNNVNDNENNIDEYLDMKNDILKDFLMYTLEEGLRKVDYVFIGSCALLIANNEYQCNKNYQHMYHSSVDKITNREVTFKRDIDVVTFPHCYRGMLSYFKQFGDVIIVSSSSSSMSEYCNNTMFDSRNISKIVSIELKFNKKLFFMYHYMRKYKFDLSINIDIIVVAVEHQPIYNSDKINEILNKWPIHCMSRNFTVSRSCCSDEIIYNEIVDTSVKKNLRRHKSIMNVIESLKFEKYKYGSCLDNKYYTKSGDLMTFSDDDEILSKNDIFSKKHRIQKCLNGINHELVDTFKISYILSKNLKNVSKMKKIVSKELVKDIKTITDSIEDVECAFCCEKVYHKNSIAKIFTTKCGHIFHLECIIPELLNYFIHLYNLIEHKRTSARHLNVNADGEINDPTINGDKCPICRHDIVSIKKKCEKIYNRELHTVDYVISNDDFKKISFLN